MMSLRDDDVFVREDVDVLSGIVSESCRARYKAVADMLGAVPEAYASEAYVGVDAATDADDADDADVLPVQTRRGGRTQGLPPEGWAGW